MKRFSEQFNKKAQDIHLNAAEMRELKERVVSYMEYHPLPASSVVSKKTTDSYAVDGQQFRVVGINAMRLMRWSGAFVVVFMLATSFMAEKAVPGDTLYAIKVGFNEELRSTMARTSYDKIVWETERLNRRISEARLLADEGRLTEEMEVQVASAVKTHSENARKEIENLKLTDKDEATLASIELTTALDVQNSSLKNRAESEEGGRSTDLIEIVLQESQDAEKTSEDNNLPAYDKLMAKVESETTRAHELLEGVKKSATTDEQKDISRRLEDIDRKVTIAIDGLESDDLLSRNSLLAALQQTHRLIVFMTNIDVRANLTVNEIVPVTLTSEERIDLVKTRVVETKKLLDSSNKVISASSTTPVEGSVLAKVGPTIKKISEGVANAESALAAEYVDIDVAENSSLEAYNLVLDVSKILSATVKDVPAKTEVEPTVIEDKEAKPVSVKGSSTENVKTESVIGA